MMNVPSILIRCEVARAYCQWRQNEFKNGGGGRSAGIFCRALHVLALQVQLVVLVSAFVMGSTCTACSVSCLPFFYSRSPRVQPFVKVGVTCPHSLWGRRHWLHSNI